MYIYVILITICMACGLQGWRTLFDNFAVNAAKLNGEHIGVIQSVREIPGLLTFLVAFVLIIISEHKLSAITVFCFGIGIGATGFFPSYYGLLITTFVMSAGFHIFESVSSSLVLQYFDKKIAPEIFGRIRSVSAASNIGIGVFILGATFILNYEQIYIVMGVLIFCIGIWAIKQDPSDKNAIEQNKKLILKKKYGLFYFLTFMSGSRRQIFIAFASLLLVKKFGFSVKQISALFITNNVINYFLSPIIGKCISRFGERKVLSLEYFSLIFVFIAYALVDSKILVSILYILDHIFFNFAIAIRTYFQKIADPKDIAPSMSVSTTINHIAAVALPALGGYLWIISYKIPFMGGAVMSFISLIAVQFIPSFNTSNTIENKS